MKWVFQICLTLLVIGISALYIAGMRNSERRVQEFEISSHKCAVKIRTAFPGLYDDLDDVTLTQRAIQKHPGYCQ
jgi:hypothetical protein